jgi:signal transduction histidine kinase
MEQATCLIVEDDPDAMKWISMVLAEAGYTIMGASNGQEGLSHIQKAMPDLILSDITMPVMDGFDFYRAVRANPAWELIPFIFTTGKGETHEIIEGKSLGVDDYLIKPFEKDMLLATVDAKLRRMRGINQATQHEMRVIYKRILALLSHELRTPLTQIRGYAELASMDIDEFDPLSLTRFLAGISSGSNRLTKLIEDLLLTVEIESGQAVRAYEQRKIRLASLPDLITDVSSTVEKQAAHKKVALSLEVPPDLPAVEAHVAYLSNALRRLFDNAIKFSLAGSNVKISAGGESEGVFIAVTDQGPGIPLEEQPFIFDIFRQVNRERYEQQGAGLGLAIARGLIELHGGEIQIKSQMGVGSTFRVMLPGAA